MKYHIFLLFTVCALLFLACGGKKAKYDTYQEAARAYDFEAAHKIVDELHDEYVSAGSSFLSRDEQKKYEAAFDYVFNAEAMFLCAQGDKESLDRIVFLLSNIPVEGMAIPEGTQYKETDELYDQRDNHDLYTRYATRFNQKCNTLIDLAIAHRIRSLAERVLPLYKDVPEPIKGREHDVDAEALAKKANPNRSTPDIYKSQIITYSRSDKEAATAKVQKAIEKGILTK